MKMSADAERLMGALTQRYVELGFPNYKLWQFSGQDGDRTLSELRALGFIEQVGTHGGPFRLTDAGQRYAMANRETGGRKDGQKVEAGSETHTGRLQMAQTPETVRTGVPDPKRVFIIHGRNVAARNEMGNFVRALGLVPINFADLRASMGGTPHIDEIVEKGMDEAQGVIAVFTPDEFSSLRPEHRQERDSPEEITRWQARPNVIFEAGMAFGRDRKRVVFVLLGNPTLFTDVAGVHVLRPNNDPRGDRAVLRNTLAGMMCAVDLTSNDWMQAGDFERCVQSPADIKPHDPFGIPNTRAIDGSHGTESSPLSSAAQRTLEEMRQECLEREDKEYESINWILDSEAEVRVYRELAKHGYVERRDRGERNWKLTESGVDKILPGAFAKTGVEDLRGEVLRVLSGLAATDPVRNVTGTFRGLAEKLQAKWDEVYQAMLELNRGGHLRVQIPDGYGPDSTFSAQLPIP